MDVGGWLKSLGLGEYEALFRASKIDADILPELTETDLEKLGVPLGAEGAADVAAAVKPEMALRRRLRCPSGTPSFSRSVSVSSGRISASISLARNSASYWPRPRLLSQPPTSMAALHGPERIIRRLKRPVQRRAVEELSWVVMTQWHRSPSPEDRQQRR